MQPGQIIILNGTPRSGKSRLAAAIQASFPGVWMNLGVDHFMAMTPAHLKPGMGLRAEAVARIGCAPNESSLSRKRIR